MNNRNKSALGNINGIKHFLNLGADLKENHLIEFYHYREILSERIKNYS